MVDFEKGEYKNIVICY